MYVDTWQLRIDGIVTGNLDRYVAKAFGQTRQTAVNEVTGYEVGRRLHAISENTPFIINVHGTIEDVGSWVLTKPQIAALIHNEAYKSFLSVLFSTKTVIFLGVTADDLAVGGRLGWLRDCDIDPGDHFWLTGRRDRRTDIWAEANGIQVIRYNSEDGHERPLKEVFQDLKKFISVDTEAPPVTDVIPGDLPDLLPPAELAQRSPEEIRNTLSAHATHLFTTMPNDAASAKYARLCDEYERAIHNAWFVTPDPPDNMLYGHQIEKEIGKGAFGVVYLALSATGEKSALKLLRQEVMGQSEMLGSFRRGVRSMRILSTAKVEGMVPYQHAYELPPCAIMEFVEGANLEDAVLSGLMGRWHDTIYVALEVAKIVRRGHLHPQRVLHRDIRPPNIMLRDFYSHRDSQWPVVVLDFDLSWHMGAAEKSINIESGAALGYLAPEQIVPITGVSTRSTSVDSFGLGMTLYFMLTHRHPAPNESNTEGWSRKLKSEIRDTDQQLLWSSLPERLVRLIEGATRNSQSERLDMHQIESELERLQEALLDSDSVESSEMWAEEIISRAFRGKNYAWNSDLLNAQIQFGGDLTLTLSGDDGQGCVRLEVDQVYRGDQERRSVDKYLPAALKRIEDVLRKGDWKLETTSSSYRALRICANIDADKIKVKPEAVVADVSKITEELAF